jgi:hypothetical protein
VSFFTHLRLSAYDDDAIATSMLRIYNTEREKDQTGFMHAGDADRDQGGHTQPARSAAYKVPCMVDTFNPILLGRLLENNRDFVLIISFDLWIKRLFGQKGFSEGIVCPYTAMIDEPSILLPC